jgi:hypothetical protein
VEKEKFVLAVEQEILRVHARVAREMSHQVGALFVCMLYYIDEHSTRLSTDHSQCIYATF